MSDKKLTTYWTQTKRIDACVSPEFYEALAALLKNSLSGVSYAKILNLPPSDLDPQPPTSDCISADPVLPSESSPPPPQLYPFES